MDEQYNSDPVNTPEQLPDNSAMDSILPPVKPRRILAGIIKLLLIIIAVAAIIGGVVWFLVNHKSAPVAAPAKKSSTSTTTADDSNTKITNATKHYDSSNYNLGFDYPNDWTVADEATAKLTATSPSLQLTGVDGGSFTGEIVFAVQNQQTSIDEFVKANDSAVATMESQKVTYTKPTPNQRAQTYVTFVNYSGSLGATDALYITGDNGYQTQQRVPQADVIQANPLVSVSFLKCADAACKTTNTPVAISTKSLSVTSFLTPILKLIKSLAIE